MLPEQNFSSPDSGVVEDFTHYFQDLKAEKIEETTGGSFIQEPNVNANVLVEYLPEIPVQNHSSFLADFINAAEQLFAKV